MPWAVEAQSRPAATNRRWEPRCSQGARHLGGNATLLLRGGYAVAKVSVAKVSGTLGVGCLGVWKKPENYLAFFIFVYGVVTFRTAGGLE